MGIDHIAQTVMQAQIIRAKIVLGVEKCQFIFRIDGAVCARRAAVQVMTLVLE